ncbi:MAG: GspE/PulE family protein [Planctomycetota bacterium]|jgi:type IV pilus assembly protein PilB
MQTQNDTLSYILQETILDEATLDELLNQQQSTGKSLIKILQEKEILSETQLARIIAVSNNIEFIDLSSEMIDPSAAHMIPYKTATQYNLIPVKQEQNDLYVAMSSPLNLTARDQIKIRTGCNIIPLAATPKAVGEAIRYHFNVQNVTRKTIESIRSGSDENKEHNPESNHEYLKKLSIAQDDPVTKLVNSILIGAIDAKASDIHIEPKESDMRVRYRIDGILHNAIDIPSSAQKEVISHIKILAEMDISEQRISQDGHISLSHNGHNYDLRVSTLPAVNGEKIVIRILDKSSNTWSLDEIATSGDDNGKLMSLAQNPYGMILLTGPTGCGKTTTLYSILQLLNTPEKNIVTVEDPVEYCLEGITQVQIKPAAGRTFASALRSIVRQDPDIILVGEIRDFETAEIAVSAALTGHLVLSTLHTSNAAGAISRLVNLGIPPYLVASCLLGTVAQRLVRMICPECKTAYYPNKLEEKQFLNMIDNHQDEIQLYQGNGCNFCMGRHYYGRKAIFEILCISSETRNMIKNGASDEEIASQAINEGMMTLRQRGIEEVLDGTTTLEELLRQIDMRKK